MKIRGFIQNKLMRAIGLTALLLMLSSVLVAQEKIAFQTNRDGNPEIYVMNTDGSNQTRLTYSAQGDIDPSFSPDGTKIVFTSSRDGNNEIYVMNADGTNQTRLTMHAMPDDEPAWSPDGSKIVFYSFRDGNGEIYVMNADGSNQTRITNSPALDMRPEFSPTGGEIVFQSSTGDPFEIFKINIDGTNQVNLTNNPANDSEPAYSPDGTKIAFHSFRNGNIDIYVMNADGSNQVSLTSNSAAFDTEAAWSPDGTKIVFNTERDATEEIYVMNADGTNQVNLTNAPGDDRAPSWSAANSAPLLSNVSVTTAINEGSAATLSGAIADSDSNDGFTLTVNWGDGSAPQIFTYPAGTTQFSETHVYEDDALTANPADDYTIGLLLSDNRFGTDTASAVVRVNNTAPSLTGLAVNPSSPGFGVPVALTGNYTDLGYNGSASDEDLKVFVNWGDGQSGFLTTSGAPGAINETHSYALPGSYTVTVKVSDNDAGETVQTANVVVAPPPPPAAPTNFKVDLVGTNRVQLAWTDTSNNEDGFIIERCNNRGCANYVEIGRTGANTTVYLDTALVNGSQYFYRMRAYNLGGTSAYTEVISAKTLRK